jgi:hypothetical protein
LGDVEAPTWSRETACKWRLVCDPYAPVALYSSKISFRTHFRKKPSKFQLHSETGRIRVIENTSITSSELKKYTSAVVGWLFVCVIVGDIECRPRAIVPYEVGMLLTCNKARFPDKLNELYATI